MPSCRIRRKNTDASPVHEKLDILMKMILFDPVMRHTSRYWIRELGLKPHPEGGHYRETYRADEKVGGAALPKRYGSARAFSTAIYFLLENGQASRFHRLRSDEIWHYHTGSPLALYMLSPAGRLRTVRLGPCPEAGERFQAIVPKGTWLGARLKDGGQYALTGCTTSPGFDFRDFKLGDRDDLLRRYPRHREVIMLLT